MEVLLMCFQHCRRGEAVVFIILSLSHSCPNWDNEILMLDGENSELIADMLYCKIQESNIGNDVDARLGSSYLMNKANINIAHCHK